MATIKTVLFDLDGTLIDSVRLILDSYHHTLELHGHPPRSDEYWLRGLGTPLWAQFREWTDDPPTLEAMITTYREYNLSNHDQRVTAYPGVVEMVGALHRRGYRLGLVTSKNRAGALRGLGVAGLTEYFDAVVGADEVENHKPHPEPVLKGVELLGAPAGQAIYIGDSVHDMRSGRAAGTATGAVLWGPFGRTDLEETKPDHWLETPSDLLRLLE